MGNRNRFVPALRWLLPILAMVLVLGHVCELSAYADLVISPHHVEGAAHTADDQAHESEMSCDPVDVLVSTGASGAGPTLSAVPVVPFAGPLLVQFVTGSLEESKRPPGRPPLFLLHASLLI
jgi:hypothetical protein